MPLANCPLCNRLFNRTLNEPCPSCREGDEASFTALFAYLGQHPDASLEKVSAATGVEPEVIRRMVRSGRLVGFDALALSVLSCQRCQQPIPSGRYCVSCQRELRGGFASAH
jgi:hypothetical protein